MITSVPFVNFKSTAAREKTKWLSAVQRVFESGWFVRGQECQQFENELAHWLAPALPNVHCVGVNSGTDALMLALKVLNLPPGGEVVVPANGCPPTPCAVVMAGLRPRFADVDPYSLLITGQTLAETLAYHPERVVAIIPVHLYGQSCNMAEILEVSGDIPVIEDCAQSHGAQHQSITTGLWGIVGAFSFYPTKNLGAIGDGGAIVTCDSDLAEKIRSLSFYGQATRYQATLPGGVNSRLDELQAAILRRRLVYLADNNLRRQQIARQYRAAIAQRSDNLITCPQPHPDSTSVEHLFVIQVANGQRQDFQNKLKKKGVDTLIHYPIPLHQQPAFAAFAPRHPLPVTEEVCQTVVSLPIYPELTNAQIEWVCTQLVEYIY